MIYRRTHLAELGLHLEQIQLQDGTLVTCIPDLGPVQWLHDQLLRSPTDPTLRNANDRAPSGMLNLSFNIYLIQSSAGTTLVDTGIGNNKTRSDRPAWHQLQGPFLEILRQLGISAIDVDLVINTHLHADHVGWNTIADGNDGWQPTFGAATYVTSCAELEALRARVEQSDNPETLLHGAWADSIRPIVEGPGYRTVKAGDIVSGLEFIALPGHTPGMLGLLFEVGEDRIVFSADAIHHPVQLGLGTGASKFCADPARSIATRVALLERCVGERLVMAPYHFPAPAFGYISQATTGFELVPLDLCF
ncbi:MBL fold metallo-hydrolase [Mesorhizobium sp. SB112]|uniref:MBL fold metallo-hydrolase n=1 Tax=Mesorhizobium sp. SB112 TaxID=3151853 RepID=UPI003266D688